MSFNQRVDRVALICGTLVIAGCSLGNPYVMRDSKDPRARFCADQSQCTVSEAKSSAYELAQLYRGKLSAHARMESAVGTGGIIVGSAVLALAIGDAHSDAYGSAGLIGATIYGLSSWYSNKPREEIYAKGLVALSCATTAVRSVDLPRTERAKLSNTANARAAIYDVQSATQKLLADVNSGLGSDDERAQAVRMIEQAQTDVTAAGVSLDAAAKLESAASSAGNTLMDGVEAISSAVDDALRKTVPEGTLALKIGSSLGDIAGKIVPGWNIQAAMPTPSPATPKAQNLGSTVSISPSLLLLSGKLIALQVEMAPIRGVLANFDGSNIATGLDACKILGLSALSIAPAEIAFMEGKAASASVVISNGKPPYSATSVGPAAPGLELKNPLPFDRRLDISITAAAPAGRHSVLVSDANGNGVALVVDIKKAATAATTGKAPSETSAVQSPPQPVKSDSLVAALNKEHSNTSLVGGKYVIANFVLADNKVSMNLKDGKKLEAADYSKVDAEIDNMSVLGKPFLEQLKAHNLILVLPK